MDRLTKINEKLKIETGKILAEELDVDGALVTVLGANASPTLEHATIWISVFPTDKIESVLSAINGLVYHIQQQVNKRFKIRKVPKIQFKVDRTEERAARIEEILSNK